MGVNENKVVIYDGECGFCNQSVLFIINREKKGIICFSASSSNYSKEQFLKYELGDISRETLIFIEDGNVYTFSDAAIIISKYLNFPWNIFYYLRVLPKGFRDPVYNVVARNRYKLWGKKSVCEIPGEDLRNRFIED